jgi:O-antigen ligase
VVAVSLRPYGTQVEPDFYGAICMVFALICIILFFSKGGGKKWQCAGALLSLLGLYFSFVRVSWLAFLLVLLLLPFCRKKISFFKLNWLSVLLIIGSIAGASAAAFYAVAPIRQICQARLATRLPANVKKAEAWKKNDSLLNVENVRLNLIQVSIRTWKEHPFLGAGPGSFAYSRWRFNLGKAGARQKVAENAYPQTNPSLLFTVLEDSGLLGFFVIMIMAAKFVFLNYKKITGPKPLLAPQTFALAVGLAALLLTYMLTNGLWLPLSWVLLGLATAHLREFPDRNDGPGTAGPHGDPCA